MVGIVEIEEIKENLLPVAEGRAANALNYDPVLAEELRAQIEPEDGPWKELDDPLELHLKYVANIKLIKAQPRGELEMCVARFDSWANYKSDIRYLRLWLEYASCNAAPLECFAYMNHQRIGVGYALYYEEWAAVLEQSSLFDRARNVLRQGIDREARPLARLEASLSALEARHPTEFRKRPTPQRAVPPTQSVKRLKVFCDAELPTEEPKQSRFPSHAPGENKVQSLRDWENAPKIESLVDVAPSARSLVIFRDEPRSPNWNSEPKKARDDERSMVCLDKGYDVTFEEVMLQVRRVNRDNHFDRRVTPVAFVVPKPEESRTGVVLARFHYGNLHAGVTEAIAGIGSVGVTEQL